MFEANKQFEPGFEEAVLSRETETADCSDTRLAELLELAAAIDCYYGPQCGFLERCALEAAERLRKTPPVEKGQGWSWLGDK